MNKFSAEFFENQAWIWGEPSVIDPILQMNLSPRKQRRLIEGLARSRQKMDGLYAKARAAAVAKENASYLPSPSPEEVQRFFDSGAAAHWASMTDEERAAWKLRREQRLNDE